MSGYIPGMKAPFSGKDGRGRPSGGSPRGPARSTFKDSSTGGGSRDQRDAAPGGGRGTKPAGGPGGERSYTPRDQRDAAPGGGGRGYSPAGNAAPRPSGPRDQRDGPPRGSASYAGAKPAPSTARPPRGRFPKTDPKAGLGTVPERPAPRPEPKPRPAPGRSILHAPQIERSHEPRPARGPAETAPDSPRGTVWLYGTHAIAAALANPSRRLRRLMVTEDAESNIAAITRGPWPVQPERTDRARLDQLLGRTTVHQGAALLADILTAPTLQQVLERPGPVLVLDQVTDPRNVGAILRSAAAFGVAAVITQDRNAPEETGTLAKAASGALESVPLLRAVNIARTLVALRAAGCWIVGLAGGGTPLSGKALAERRIALVLGSEGEGMRRLTRDSCDEVCGIGMPGAGDGLDSLNVSAAATVALYELGRRG